MSKEDTKEMIKVMQAWVDGKKVECKFGGTYKDRTSPCWNWYGKADMYRIKGGE